MLIDGKHYSWTQPVCTHCWIQDNTVIDPNGGAIIKKPVIIKAEEWEERLENCCKCGRATTSGIFVRIDPSTVDYPTEDDL